MLQAKLIEYKYEDLPAWKLIGDPQYTESIYSSPPGVRNPIIVAEWEGTISLVAGNRRVLSYIKAHKQAEDDETLESRPWLNSIPALLYSNIPPALQKAWALADNEERSSNPIHAYLVIKSAQLAGQWETVNQLFKMHKTKLGQIMEYDNLTPELLQAVIDGKMTKSVALKAARLGKPRQDYLVSMAKSRPGEFTVTEKDVKAVKEARAQAVLETLAPGMVPQNRVTVVDKTMFLVMSPTELEGLIYSSHLYDSFPAAYEAGLADGKEVYRLVQV